MCSRKESLTMRRPLQPARDFKPDPNAASESAVQFSCVTLPDCIVNIPLSDGLRQQLRRRGSVLGGHRLDQEAGTRKTYRAQGYSVCRGGSFAWVSGKSLRLTVLYRTPCWLPNMAYRASCCQTME
jgi:hypothetical protein